MTPVRIFCYRTLGQMESGRLAAVVYSKEPAWGAAAFERLRDQNLAEDDVPRWYELLFSTHPPLGARIAKLRGGRASSASPAT